MAMKQCLRLRIVLCQFLVIFLMNKMFPKRWQPLEQFQIKVSVTIPSRTHLSPLRYENCGKYSYIRDSTATWTVSHNL